MKTTRKRMEEYVVNNPKTYGIVYKGSVEVIKFQGQQMYFRSRDLAERFKTKAEPVFCDVELEVIQFNPTAEEKRNRAVVRDLSHEISVRKKNAPRTAKNRYKQHSSWLSRLKKDRKNWISYIKKQKKQEEKDSEDYF
jgi:hypothetical protein